MKELKQLEIIAKQRADNFEPCTFADTKDILAIAEAFQELEQRAEAAEAKLAELEKQEPIGYTTERAATYEVWNSGSACFWNDKANGDFPLYVRPASAVSLAQLVPDEMTLGSDTGTVTETGHAQAVKWWNACRVAILRNIEEANK